MSMAMDFIRNKTKLFLRVNGVRNWSRHECPHCGAGLSRLILLSGVTHPKMGVKASIECRDCGRKHKIRGHGEYERTVFAVADSNVRRSISVHDTMRRQGRVG